MISASAAWAPTTIILCFPSI